MVSQVREAEKRQRRPRNRRGQGARLRDELIQAARQLLMTAERESDLSIRAVTRAAGAAPQSFYLQFADLDELLYAVYALEFEDLRETLTRAADSADGPTARLLAVSRAYCDFAQAHPGRYRLLTSVTGQAHDTWRGEGRSLPGAPAFVMLQETVTAALTANAVSTDPFLAASTLWACLHGIATLRAARPAFAWPPLDDMLRGLIRQLLRSS